MAEQAFTFNKDAHYPGAGGVYKKKEGIGVSLTEATIQVSGGTAGFLAKFPNVFTKYKLPYMSNNTIVDKWHSTPMQFWQNQLNFAVWCATTGCGVSKEDHMASHDPQIRALFCFHVYFQVRRILAELQCPLPQDNAWSAFQNAFDRRAYERICAEFGVSPHTDWRQKQSSNQGLGLVYFYATHVGYMPVYGAGSADHYDPGRMSFTKKTGGGTLHVDYIAQGSEAVEAWSSFMLDKSLGFTHAGVERVNDSIRTYVWAILGAQAQTRTTILGIGTAFDAQKQFLANVEDAISSPVDLPAAIARYQDVLRYAESKVDFVFGIDLYMAPSDMRLRVGKVEGYNNKIIVAGPEQTLGFNAGANADPVEPPPQSSAGQRPKASQAQTEPQISAGQKAEAEHHNSERTALVVGGVALGLVSLLLATCWQH